MPKLDASDLWKFNQLIHKLDDIAGSGNASPYADMLRQIRDILFDEEGEPRE